MLILEFMLAYANIFFIFAPFILMLYGITKILHFTDLSQTLKELILISSFPITYPVLIIYYGIYNYTKSVNDTNLDKLEILEKKIKELNPIYFSKDS